MQIKIKIAPKIITGASKRAVLDIIGRNFCRGWNTLYTACLVPYRQALFETFTTKSVRVYNIEKRNKKVTRIRKGTKTTSKVISPAHWVCHYYDIDIATLKAANIKVVQHHRHFELISLS